MKRGRRLVLNIGIILILLLANYYFGGFYFSKQQCVTETLRGLYGYETTKIMELESGSYTATLMADPDAKTFSIVGTRRFGCLYRTATSSIGHTINERNAIDVYGIFSSDIGSLIFLYRNDKSVEQVEVVLDSGEHYLVDEWHQDFGGFLGKNKDDWSSGTYRAYNASGEMVGEVSY